MREELGDDPSAALARHALAATMVEKPDPISTMRFGLSVLTKP